MKVPFEIGVAFVFAYLGFMGVAAGYITWDSSFPHMVLGVSFWVVGLFSFNCAVWMVREYRKGPRE